MTVINLVEILFRSVLEYDKDGKFKAKAEEIGAKAISFILKEFS